MTGSVTDETRRMGDIERPDGPAAGSTGPASGPATGPERPGDGPARAQDGGERPDDAEQRDDAEHRNDGERPGGGEQAAAVPVGAGSGTSRRTRRRRLIVAGVIVGAALLVLAICAGLAAVLSAVDRFSDDARQVRQGRELRQLNDTACLELEDRLNRVAPPGSTTTPAARAGAIRNENAALRPYLTELQLRERDDPNRLTQWRQLLDARTAYAEALDRSAPTRTPAFFVVPRTNDGLAVADQLARWSSAACGGPVRRLAAPDL